MQRTEKHCFNFAYLAPTLRTLRLKRAFSTALIIVGVMAIGGNICDRRVLKLLSDQVNELTGGKIEKPIIDKGYKVKEHYGSRYGHTKGAEETELLP